MPDVRPLHPGSDLPLRRARIGSGSAPVPGSVESRPLPGGAPQRFSAEGSRVAIGDVVCAELRLDAARLAGLPDAADVVELTGLVEGSLRCIGSAGARTLEAGGLVVTRPVRGDALEAHAPVRLTRTTLPAAAFGPDGPPSDLVLLRTSTALAHPFALVVDAVLDRAAQGWTTAPAALRDAVVELALAVVVEAEDRRRTGAPTIG